MANAQPMPTDGAQGGQRTRVLVIDDEGAICRSAYRILGRRFDVTCTESAVQALDLIRAGKTFDVVFRDLMMPDLTGMEFYAELQRTMPMQAERVAFLSGGAFTPQAKAFLESVPGRVLEKPFDGDALHLMVTKLKKEDAYSPRPS